MSTKSQIFHIFAQVIFSSTFIVELLLEFSAKYPDRSGFPFILKYIDWKIAAPILFVLGVVNLAIIYKQWTKSPLKYQNLWVPPLVIFALLLLPDAIFASFTLVLLFFIFSYIAVLFAFYQILSIPYYLKGLPPPGW